MMFKAALNYRRVRLGITSGLLMGIAGCQSAHIEESYSREQTLDIRDQDGDGVVNVRDICGNTPLDSLVDIRGCSEWAVESRHTDFVFNFDFDSYILRDDQAPIIEDLVATLNEYPDARIALVGDTSSEGTDEYNHALGQRRGERIITALEQRGIDSSRVLKLVYDDPMMQQVLKKRERRTIVRVMYYEAKPVPQWTIYTVEDQRKETP